ncbi:Retrovirus-related Pol polyprotein from transposon RE1 [Vitis vinifera]|uniref:Retrovirus-related Pol polyprotein from transposon RE1 n=1 Tax=Vitis vinifera TaxID=29760 RepID=A0A438HGW0_VITVI|nr:Retrovirus-related Pol polyprotein from transposon RE1 [Vitis vinifera]
MGFIDGNRPCPPPILKVNGVDMINPEYSLWICQDQPILNVIVGSLSSRIILFITSLKTSKNAWTTLATTYAKPSRGRVMQIKGQLANLYKGSQRVIEYMQQIKSRSDELAMMDAPINSEDLTIKILEELSAEYKDIALAVQARETPISFEELA